MRPIIVIVAVSIATPRITWFEVAPGATWRRRVTISVTSSAATDADRAQFKMRAFGQRHVDIEPFVTAPCEQEKRLAPRAFGNVDLVTLNVDLARRAPVDTHL
jgi:hypothetical protein